MLHDAYIASLEELRHLDHALCAEVLDLQTHGRVLEVPFFDQDLHISSRGIVNANGENPTDAVGLVLCRYLLNCPKQPLPEGPALTFRELEGAGPLVARFAANTHKLIASAFADDLPSLESAGGQMRGVRQGESTGYDLVMAFSALPRISLVLKFNGADDLFPAQCSLLFNHCAQGYLDMQSIFTLGTYLAGRLLGHSSKLA